MSTRNQFVGKKRVVFPIPPTSSDNLGEATRRPILICGFAKVLAESRAEVAARSGNLLRTPQGYPSKSAGSWVSTDRWLRALMFFLPMVVSCTSDDLPNFYRLDRFRVLALVADQPEVNPGQTVSISPFLSDPEGEGRTIEFSVTACIDPGVGVGAEPTCDGSETQTTVTSLSTVTGLSGPLYTGLTTSAVNVTIPNEAIIFANISDVEKFNGVDYLIVFDFLFPDGSSFRAFRKILVSARPTKHQNPTLQANPIRSDGQTLSQFPEEKITLSAAVDASSQEEFEQFQNGSLVVTQESPITFWYVVEGELSTNITDDVVPTTNYTPAQEPQSDQLFVIVTSDQRGGIATFSAEF